MLIADALNAYIASLLFGLFYGLGFCASACLPYLTGYIAGIGAGFRRGVFVTATYNMGRVAAYTFIGWLAYAFKLFLNETAVQLYQKYASLTFGLLTIIVGITIILGKGRPQCPYGKKERNPPAYGIAGKIDARALAMGFARGIIVCPPLIAILTYSLSTSTVSPTLSAFFFGAGTAFSPLFLIGGVSGWLFNKAPLFSKWISRAGAGVLIILGLGAAVGAVTA
ncbi:MAG: sulfite exporter TauE/SafE family protein [Candidatus Bathyarchaeia archaeon]